MDQPLFEYLLARHAGRQWNGFLGALAAELIDHLNRSDMRAIMHRAGARFAAGRALPVCETLADAQASMNAVWTGLDWGWVVLQEHSRCLAIRHYCAPLDPDAELEQGEMVASFLEGVYQHWFQALGSGTALRVRKAEGAGGAGFIEYRLEQ